MGGTVEVRLGSPPADRSPDGRRDGPRRIWQSRTQAKFRAVLGFGGVGGKPTRLTGLFSCQEKGVLWAGFQLPRWGGWGEEMELVFERGVVGEGETNTENHS